LEFTVTTVPGRDNTVNMPIYLLPLDLGHGLSVDETHGGTLTIAEIPGFALEIAPGSVTFPGGSKSGLVSVTVVHSDKVPMVPNFGQQPRLIVTIQPAGARFEPPARMTLPNVEGLSPGEVTEMYSFDHDLGHFVSIGPATVSEDGAVIVSNPGVGVTKAGWHCGGNPATAGSPNSCPGCLVCNGSQCVPGCSLSTALATGPSYQSSPASCCTPTKLCETTPGTCLPGGGCQGVPLQVTGIDGACVAEQGVPTTFLAQTSDPAKVEWSIPNATPDRGQGPSLSVRFASTGHYAVAACAKQTMIDVGTSCPATYQLEIVGFSSVPQQAWGWTVVQDPHADLVACVKNALACVSMVKFRQARDSVVPASITGKTNLTGAQDQKITAQNCAQVIADFTPQDPCKGPPRTTYWMRSVTLDHENKHLADQLQRVIQKTANDFTKFLKTSTCGRCFRDLPKPDSLFKKLAEIFNANRLAYDTDKECVAHGVSNPEYTAVIADIHSRARQEGWAQCQ
jgi:hypothetical protein